MLNNKLEKLRFDTNLQPYLSTTDLDAIVFTVISGVSVNKN